jgi:hypothetical protein
MVVNPEGFALLGKVSGTAEEAFEEGASGSALCKNEKLDFFGIREDKTG